MMEHNKTYFFKDYRGYLVWAVVSVDKVVCYCPQYGSWYDDTRVNLSGIVDEQAAKVALVASDQTIVGDGAEMTLRLGEYYPRIWRGLYSGGLLADGYDRMRPREVYGKKYTQCLVAAESLFLEVKDLFRVIEPCEENFLTFGHRLREMLILLCTEVEACLAAVFNEHSRDAIDPKRLNTQHYVRTSDPLRLKEWRVKLLDYMCEFQPFQNWSSARPTESLEWYSAYNKVKHDREANFDKSSLRYVLEAAAALHIMQVAQFGPGIFSMLQENRFSIFDCVVIPKFEVADIYLSKDITGQSFDSPRKMNI